MAKNANKILKEIAVKMGGNVGEKDNDTNEFLTSIATSMGATLDKKHNTNELLEIIRDNISEGGSGSGGSEALPFGQTNPDVCILKMYSLNNSVLTIDFNKFADWYEQMIGKGIIPPYGNLSVWTDDMYNNPHLTLIGLHINPGYNDYDNTKLEINMEMNYNGGTPYISCSSYNNGYYFNDDSDRISIELTKEDDRSPYDYIRSFGNLTIDLSKMLYGDELLTVTPFHVDQIYGFRYSNPYDENPIITMEQWVEFLSTIDWLKISAKN